ncbi:hypothetical protein Poly51_42760 [Rubripirellula tenax]|uniref:Secreted protein n=1 Tax=Rubripirellula tenax TaxID=2528015 RepID=A0A5C6EML0_9BACT|nr:hypothetical protein [Rubripirellula tenax]TWU50983.1 hypothetical protein Poly51_42760 [Rubripirellula tenax]
MKHSLKIFFGILMALPLVVASGCSGSSDPEVTSDASEVQNYLDQNPESANLDMEPPPDPE